jgi:hypothetical protein
MGFTGFLTQGTPNTSTTKAYTTTEIPQYMSDYLSNLLAGSYAAANEGYIPYGPAVPADIKAKGPQAEADYLAGLPKEEFEKYKRIADFDPMQTSAFETGKTAAKAYETGLAEAEKTAGTSGALSTIGAADPYLKAASAAAPTNVTDYLNPYQTNVTDRMGDLAQRQITEKLMPALGDQFIRAGQYGSTRQQELAQRGVRDIASELQANIGTQLAKGYDTSLSAAQKDLDRQATLAQTAGTLTGTEEANKNALANVQANLAGKAQSLGLTGAAAEEAIGAQNRDLEQQRLDLAYEDFEKQRDDPMKKATFLNEQVRGLPSTGQAVSKNETNVGNTYSASPLASIAGAASGASALSTLLK